MWHEIHYCKLIQRWALYVGTSEGYYIGRVYGSKTTAKISARIRGYRFCMN